METILERNERLNMQAWTGTLHRAIAADRGITCDEIASEAGIAARTVDRHLAGQTPGLADAVDDALTRISARRCLTPPSAIRVRGPLQADGLPTVIELLDPEYQAYLQETLTKELMARAIPTQVRSARFGNWNRGNPPGDKGF